eukprot:m.51758 g.51758  ORF g.51758 m.51758 type:complete len:516 (+) comp12246_c1_seq1:293-1840(+)
MLCALRLFVGSKLGGVKAHGPGLQEVLLLVRVNKWLVNALDEYLAAQRTVLGHKLIELCLDLRDGRRSSSNRLAAFAHLRLTCVLHAALQAVVQHVEAAPLHRSKVLGDFVGEAIGVERMLAREQIKRPRQQRVHAQRTRFVASNDAVLVSEVLDVAANTLCGTSGVVHLALELFDFVVVLLERFANVGLKMVDGDKVWEKRQNVLDFQQVALLQNSHGLFDVALLLDHVPRDAEPELLAELLVVRRHVRVEPRQLQVNLERKVNSLLVQPHGAVNRYTRPLLALLGAEAQGVLSVVQWLLAVLFQEHQEPGLVWQLDVEGHKIVVDGCVGVAHFCDTPLEVADGLVHRLRLDIRGRLLVTDKCRNQLPWVQVGPLHARIDQLTRRMLHEYGCKPIHQVRSWLSAQRLERAFKLALLNVVCNDTFVVLDEVGVKNQIVHVAVRRNQVVRCWLVEVFQNDAHFEKATKLGLEVLVCLSVATILDGVEGVEVDFHEPGTEHGELCFLSSIERRKLGS